MTVDVTIREITPAETYELRRRILRAGTPSTTVEWRGDDDPTTVHLGAAVGRHVVAISTWLVAPDPIAPEFPSMQVRGMATEPSSARSGLGRALLDAGLERARNDGFERAWANARVSAIGFYEAAGWIATGPVFETADTGLSHRHVHILLD